MADIIQIRRDTAANWTNANPTLANGEQGYETDTGKMKIGDGSTAWTSLEYFAGSSGGVTDHGALTGLSDDDHIQYLLANGTRSLSGNWYPDGNGTRKIGDSTHKLAEIWAVDGIFGDLVFEEKTCYICGETFNINDVLSLIVIKTSSEGTHTVPVHSRCTGRGD